MLSWVSLWVAQWYAGIAEHGYGYTRTHPDGRSLSDQAPVGAVQWMGYTESLFTALTVWAVYFVQVDRWLAAGLLASLSGLTRPAGGRRCWKDSPTSGSGRVTATCCEKYSPNPPPAPADPLANLGFDTDKLIYAGFLAIIVNVVVCVIATFLFRALKLADGVDITKTSEYFADRDDPRVRDLPEVVQ